MLTAYALGGHKWGERVLITYLEKPGSNKQFFRDLYKKATERAQVKRDFVEKRQVMTIEQLLAIDDGQQQECDGSCRGKKYVGVSKHFLRIWDQMNENLHGKHLSFVQVFDEWLDRLQDPEAIEYYKSSPHQK